MRIGHLVSALALVALAAAPAAAQTGFSATLNFANEVASPCLPNPSTGFGTFVLNAAQTQLSFNISVALDCPENASHLHLAPIGVNGGIVKNLPNGANKVGVWSSTDATQPLTPALVGSLLAGNLYVNVHTSTNGGLCPTGCPQGAIRGQVLQDQATPARAQTWGRLRVIYR